MEHKSKRILISSKDKVFTDRPKTIRKFLQPLVPDTSKFSVQPKSCNSTEYIVAAADNHNPSSRYDQMRFKTQVQNLRAMYYERWNKFYQGKEEFFYLDRAYLHFYFIDTSPKPEEKEFVLLHCDPNEPDDANHAKYKQSLHLHIECSERSCYPHCDIWPHAHIALNTGYLDHVLQDVNSLTKAIEEAVWMLKEEVLEPFSRLTI
jgi:hypothetical protein